MPLKTISVLVPGKLNVHALARVRAEFNAVEISGANASELSAAQRADIQGIAAMTTISGPFMAELPNLKIVANFGVGYDAVDSKYAGANGIMVTNTPDVLTEEDADTAIGLLLNTSREFSAAER